jgi:hypothetical protein
MSKVYILGAGASRSVYPTAPLTAGLLPNALRLHQCLPTHCLPRPDEFTAVWNFINDLYLSGSLGGLLTWIAQQREELASNAPEDRDLETALEDKIERCLEEETGIWLPTMEDMLSQIDFAILEGRPLSEKYTILELRRLRHSFVYVLCQVLENRLKHSNPQPGGERAHVLENLIRKIEPEDSIISLNYDLIADNVLFKRMRSFVNYGFEVRYDILLDDQVWGHAEEVMMQPASYSVHERANGGSGPTLLKLHGSLNWVYCPLCQQLDVTVACDRITVVKGIRYIFENPNRFCCPVCRTNYEPLIITPTLLKSYGNLQISQSWRKAEIKISEADELVFVGYSLPDADIQLRCMFKRALYHRSALRSIAGKPKADCNISVISNGDASKSRYEKFFGQVTYTCGGLEAYLG